MKTAKLFKNGDSQAVRLPKEFRVKGKEVYINKIDDVVLITPKSNRLERLRRSLEKFTKDFMDERNQPVLRKREDIE